MNDISKSINKVDNEEKLSGKAKYINDYVYDDMLYAKTLRATKSKARILSIKYPKLKKGYYIVDHKDVLGKNSVKIIYDDMPIFSEGNIEYYGEPIALVVGKDRDIIKKIIDNTKIIYEEKLPCYKLENSVIHYDYDKGKAKKIFENPKRNIKYEYNTGYQEHVYIETQGIIGLYETNKVTIIGSIQCPYYVKNAIMQALDMGDKEVRVKQATTGGAFGGKEEFPSLIACQVAAATLKIKKPIKLVFDRNEDMEYTTKRHPAKINFEAAIGKDNQIEAIKAYVRLDAGAYIGLSGVVLQRAMIASSGVYSIKNIMVSGDVCLTNTVPNGAFRGFGAPQMMFAIEMFMHHIAKQLHMDPLIMRKKYLVKQGDETSTGGIFRDPIIMEAMIDKVIKMSDYNNKIKEYSRQDSYKGIGMSWFLHGCGFTGSGEQKHIKALVKLRKEVNNTVTILIASVDMGQGLKTTMRKIVADILQLPIEQIIFNNPDTDLVPDSGPTVASRTIMIVGGLVAIAAKRLKEQWVDGEEINVKERYKQPSYIKWDEDTLTGDAYPAYSWGVNVVEVEINKETYQVELKNVYQVYEIGKAIDERIVIGQAEGGVLQGISYGMLEVMESKNGRIQQKNITDYIIPTASDSVSMDTVLMDNPYRLGPYGAKGAGELTLIGGAPAVALAIENAINRKVTKIPVTPEYIMELIKNEKN